MFASKFGDTDSNIETVKLLLENGADINLKNNDGETALMIIFKYNNTRIYIEIIKLLSIWDSIKQIEKIKIEMEGKNKEMQFYKMSVELHPNGEYIKELKKQLFEKFNESDSNDDDNKN